MNQNNAAREFGRLVANARRGWPGSGNSGGTGGSGQRPPNLGALLGGSGVVIALIGAGVALNSALYNGLFCSSTESRETDAFCDKKLTVDIEL